MKSTDTKPFCSILRPSDVKNVSDNHFRLNMGAGFGLDLVLLYSFSVAFRSFDGRLLELTKDGKWPGPLFNPIIGKS